MPPALPYLIWLLLLLVLVLALGFLLLLIISLRLASPYLLRPHAFPYLLLLPHVLVLPRLAQITLPTL